MGKKDRGKVVVNIGGASSLGEGILLRVLVGKIWCGAMTYSTFAQKAGGAVVRGRVEKWGILGVAIGGVCVRG